MRLKAATQLIYICLDFNRISRTQLDKGLHPKPQIMSGFNTAFKTVLRSRRRVDQSLVELASLCGGRPRQYKLRPAVYPWGRRKGANRSFNLASSAHTCRQLPPEKLCCTRCLWSNVEIARRADLFNPSIQEQYHFVGHLDGFILIVSDKERCNLESPLQAGNKSTHFRPQTRIQRSERFVEQ